MKNFVLIIVLSFLFSNAAYADAVVSSSEINGMLEKLDYLYKEGVKIQKLRTSDLSVLRKCVDDHGYLRDQAKELRARAQNLAVFKYRLDLTLAADAAFTCVYCSGNGRGCAEIPETIQKVKGHLREDQGKLAK